MYERFSGRARIAMQLANQEAQRFNHEYIGTEHILLGLVKDESNVVAMLLGIVDLRKIRLEVEKIVQSGPEMVPMDKLPQTPRAKKVIEYAIEEARNLNYNYVGTEHLLLGLLREEEGVAAQVLMNLGLKLEDVRKYLLDEYKEDTLVKRNEFIEQNSNELVYGYIQRIERQKKQITRLEHSCSQMKRYIIKLSAKIVELELDLMDHRNESQINTD